MYASGQIGLTSNEYRDALVFLAGEEGYALLATASALPEDRLVRITTLRRKHPPEIVQVAVEQLELRRRAKAKFSNAASMFFTPEGLEQSTSESIAEFRASRFPLNAPILDACCGIGGDAIALSRRAKVLSVDFDPAVAFCAQRNALLSQEEAGARSQIEVLCADAVSLDLAELRKSDVQFAFFDPSRRADSRAGGRKRVADSRDYSPPLNWTTQLREHFAGTAVKVSPAIDDETLLAMGGRVEFISDRGECKEAVLWFDELARDFPSLPPISYEMRGFQTDAKYSATLLRPETPPVTLQPFECSPILLSEPQEWLYEPDPAVIRAHLLPELGGILGAALIDFSIAYMTAPKEIETPFASSYKIMETLPFNLKLIQAKLRQLGGKITVVKKRGVIHEPDQVRKSLKPCGEAEFTLVLTHRGEKQIAMICEPRNKTQNQS